MWFPVEAQYISYVNLALISATGCDGTVYDLYLRVKNIFDITNKFLRYGFLLMFNTFHMSILLMSKSNG